MPLNPIVADLVDDADDDDFTGPPPTADQVAAALKGLDKVAEAVDRARAALADGTIDQVLVGFALDAVAIRCEPLTRVAFDMHGMAD